LGHSRLRCLLFIRFGIEAYLFKYYLLFPDVSRSLGVLAVSRRGARLTGSQRLGEGVAAPKLSLGLSGGKGSLLLRVTSRAFCSLKHRIVCQVAGIFLPKCFYPYSIHAAIAAKIHFR
jgi:hypothetical protein